MPFVPLIVDNFNDTPGLAIRSHVADTGETYWSSNIGTFNFLISPAGDSLITGTQNGGGWQLNAGGGAVHNINDEVWMDLTRSDGPLNAHGMALIFLSSGQTALTQWYQCKVLFDFDTNNVEIEMQRTVIAVASQSDTLLGNFPFAQTTSLRVGVTIKGDDEYDIWYEPFGGGARTVFATWTPTPNAAFTGWVGDNTHKWLGLFSQLTGFETVKTEIEVITLQTFIAGVGPITGLDFTFSANNPVNDIGFCGGAAAAGVILPVLEDNESWWWIKSDNVLDDREVTFYGKTQSGELRQENLTLSGTDYVISKMEFARPTRISVNQVSATDEITIGRALRTGIKPKVLITLPINVIFMSIPLKNSKSGLSEVVRYEKMHFENSSAENFVDMVAVMNADGAIDGTLQIATEATLNTTSQVENRLQPPSGVTFVDTGVDVVLPTPMAPGDKATIWIKQTLSAGQVVPREDAVAKINIDGTQPIGGPVAGDYTFLVEPAINIFKKEYNFHA